ncbi:hypothetical protein [Flavobacterium sp. ASW18X]|uniref:hypothetical protein n=1 Tax=Flavobacterium sp. ASW18X TaxID=2572595 RepID=UPI001F103F11|nr:hypothetical protein [Flavobacterium sp. ASW18X]
MMRLQQLLALLLFLIVFACGKKDDGPPPAPEEALLVFPDKDAECTTGVSLNATQSQVRFEWQPSANTDLYTLTIINLNTNTPQAFNTMNTSLSVAIDKGAPYSWSVLSSSNDSNETATSDNWLFYNAGAQTTYAPFPAQVIAPISGSTIQLNDAGEVSLKWYGSDVEEDIENYKVYFSTENPPLELVATLDATVMETVVDAEENTIYFWRVITTDSEGNTSDSGVLDFKVF